MKEKLDTFSKGRKQMVVASVREWNSSNEGLGKDCLVEWP